MSTNNDNLGRIANALERIATALEGGAALRPAQQAGSASTGGQRSNTPRSGLPTNFPNYGRSKGKPIAGAATEELEYYANGARRSLADPTKDRFHEKERALLAAIEAELAGRDTDDRRPRGPAVDDAYEPPRPTGPSYTSGPPDDFEPPPISDEDIPF